MSIFGHLAAPVNGLCLITLCLLSAGSADGYNSFLSPQLPLICVEPVHKDATGQTCLRFIFRAVGCSDDVRRQLSLIPLFGSAIIIIHHCVNCSRPTAHLVFYQSSGCYRGDSWLDQYPGLFLQLFKAVKTFVFLPRLAASPPANAEQNFFYLNPALAEKPRGFFTTYFRKDAVGRLPTLFFYAL